VYDARCQDPLTGRYRLDGFIMRSQVELLLQQGVHCDQHGRYLHQPPDVPAFEQRVAAVMANRLQHHPSGGPAYFKELAEAAAAAERRRSSSGEEQQGQAPCTSPGGLATLSEVASRFEIQVRLQGCWPLLRWMMLFLLRFHGGLGRSLGSWRSLQDVPPYLNLDPFLNQAPVTVRLATPAMRVHAMFVSLSLR
jgi:chloride channel 7